MAAFRLMLALVIVLQAGLSASAMARMDAGRLAPESPQFDLVICTPDGIKTVQLSPAGTGQPGHVDCECPCATLCAAFANASFATAAGGEGPKYISLSGHPLWPALDAGVRGPRASALPGSPRAPPFQA
jgi:hypothetical protein